ncbi:hypothetical protein NQD34_013630 [Periophthalmus magnuspinnatus]|nr:hypothetical protein NQD34_013630 [Periophthalmus magnuspinnatus]
MQEASAVSGGQVEEALSLAFTQVLTVASTEPCSLKGNTSHIHHSTDRPLSKGMCPASNPSPLLSQSPSVSKSPSVQSPVVTEKVKKPSLQTHATRHDRKAQSSVVPSTHPQLTARITALPSSMGEVSFEKIYQYLSALHRPSQPCKLSPMESAVVLDLLMALPEELLVLDSDPLIQHFTQSYQNLLSGADKMVKQQQPAGIPPPNHQQSPTGLTDHNQPPQTGPPHHQPPPNGPPDHHQPSSRPTNHQQPPTTGPTEHQQPPTTGPTEHQQPPTTGPTEHQLPTTGSTAKQDPPTAPTNHQPPPTRPTETQGDSSIRNTSLRQNAPLNPFLIPVSLMSRKAQTDT